MNGLLLADRSPSLRYRALTELDDVPVDDPEVVDLRREIADGDEVRTVLDAMRTARDYRALAYELCRLAHLGYDGPEVEEAAERIFDHQMPDGSWPLWLDDEQVTGSGKPARKRGRKQPPARPRSETYAMMPIQTSLPLRGVAAAGYATDPRAELAYEWLLEQRLTDGAWPGDLKADLGVGGLLGGRTPGYRKLPRSTGCRSATTGALACFALHPERRTSAPARDALDHVLARETRDEWSLGHEVARLRGFERASGRLTFYATFDLAFLLHLSSRCGAAIDDVRIADLTAFLEERRGPFGLWEHPTHPQLSRWLTFDLELSFRLLSGGDWHGTDIRVGHRAYPKARPRY